MIGKLTGIIDTTIHPPIMEVGDVGYSVHIPQNVKATGAKQILYIHTYVREDALDLYGFTTLDDLSLFKLLITVSGIGPRTALLIMDKGSDAIERAIRESDVDFFTSIPRLGKKNAQKVIIELKSKIGSFRDLDLKDEGTEGNDLVNALVSMGFARKEVHAIIPKIDAILPIEQKIRAALKLLGK